MRVASRHARIQVPRDPDLQRAIVRARRVIGPDAPASQVVRALALRGAETLDADQEAEQRATDFLVSVAEGASGLDLDALRTVRERVWR